MPGWFINTGVLFAHADAACKRIPVEITDRAGGQPEALTAVIFSVTTLEAFIHEFADLASVPASSEGPNSRLATLATIIDELEQSHASLESKFWFAKWILSGENYDKGQHPYQDFKLLIDLRNSLIHSKTDRFEVGAPSGIAVGVNSPAWVRGLESKGLTGVVEGGAHASRVAKVSTRAVAQWSCNTTVAMAQSILETLSPNAMLRRMFAGAFSGGPLFPTSPP